MGSLPFGRALGVELARLRTMPMAAWLAVSGVGLALMFALVTLGVTGPEARDGLPGLASEEGQRLLLSSGAMAAVCALVVGIVVTAGEYRHGTIVTSLLLEPRRGRLLLVKAATVAALGGCVGAVAGAAVVAVGVPGLSVRGVELVLGWESLAAVVAGTAAVGALLAVAGAAVGAICRDQLVAIVASLVVLYVVDPVVSQFVPAIERFGPGGLTETLAGAPPDGAPAALVAALVLAGACAALLAVAAARQRGDVA